MKQKGRRISAGFLRQIFTPQERTAVAFLLAVGFLGLGIRAFQTGAPGFDQQAVRWPEGRGGASSNAGRCAEARGGASASAGRCAEARGGASASAGRWQAVSVNRAGIAELTALPGIGPVTARRIAEHRRLHGRFLTLTDLKQVKGISPRTLERLKGYVRFD